MNDADAKRIAYDYGLDLGAPGYAYADGVFGCSDIRTRRRGWGIKRWQLSNAERIIIPNVAVLIGSVFFVESFAKPGGHYGFHSL